MLTPDPVTRHYAPWHDRIWPSGSPFSPSLIEKGVKRSVLHAHRLFFAFVNFLRLPFPGASPKWIPPGP